MEGLALVGEGGHDVAEECGDEVGDHFAEVTAGGATETNALAGHVSDDQAENFFAEGSLPIGAFHEGVVEPGENEADGRGQEKDSDQHDDADVVHVFVGMEVFQELVQAGQKDQGDQDQNKAQTEDGVINNESQEADPKAGVVHAGRSSNSSVGGLGSGAGRQNRSLRDGGERKSLATVRAKCCAIGHGTAAFGAIHAGPSFGAGLR